MKYKYILATIVLLVIAGSVGIMLAMRNSTNSEIIPNTPASKTSSKNVADSKNVVSVKKGIKRFSLTTKGTSGVSGDGSITLKDDLTSMAARLIEAPALSGSNQYEIYIVPAGDEPVFAGTLQTFSNPNAKFLWGGAGEVSWFEAEKIIVTRRAPNQSKPGTIVAEGTLPMDSEPVQ